MFFVRRSFINIGTLAVVFTLSFASYMTTELNASLQVIPLALFAVLVLAQLFSSDEIILVLYKLFRLDSLLFVILVCALILATSIASASDKSLETAIVLVSTILLGRVYMSMIPPREVLEAFFWSGIASVALLVVAGFSSFLDSLSTFARFSPFSFHPNLLGFLAAGYFSVMMWKVLTSSWLVKVLSAIVAFICLVVIFFASSRGSLLGIVVGCCVGGLLILFRADRERRLRVYRWIGMLLLAAVGLFAYAQHFEWLQDAYGFADHILAITASDRGIGSGFTGRFDKWNATLNLMSDGQWLVGKGLRSSDAMTDDLIDNSYLVILYESGLLTLVIIVFGFFDIERRLVFAYGKAIEGQTRSLYLAYTILITVFLTNNFVARYLFSVGNPYSLLALLIFVCPKDRLISGEYLVASTQT